MAEEVLSLIGLPKYSYYRRYVKSFARVASHLNSIITQGKHFELNKSCDEAFIELK